jgi:hypothetical protein
VEGYLAVCFKTDSQYLLGGTEYPPPLSKHTHTQRVRMVGLQINNPILFLLRNTRDKVSEEKKEKSKNKMEWKEINTEGKT